MTVRTPVFRVNAMLQEFGAGDTLWFGLGGALAGDSPASTCPWAIFGENNGTYTGNLVVRWGDSLADALILRHRSASVDLDVATILRNSITINPAVAVSLTKLDLVRLSAPPAQIADSGYVMADRTHFAIRSATDLARIDLPTPYAGALVLVSVISFGSAGHRIYPPSGCTISWTDASGTTKLAQPYGISGSASCRLKLGVYWFSAVSSTEWLVSSGSVPA